MDGVTVSTSSSRYSSVSTLDDRKPLNKLNRYRRGVTVLLCDGFIRKDLAAILMSPTNPAIS